MAQEKDTSLIGTKMGLFTSDDSSQRQSSTLAAQVKRELEGFANMLKLSLEQAEQVLHDYSKGPSNN